MYILCGSWFTTSRGQVLEMWIWCFRFLNGYTRRAWRADTSCMSGVYLNNTSVTETQLQRHSSSPSLSFSCLPLNVSTEDVAKILGSNTPNAALCAEVWQLLERFVSIFSVLSSFHWRSQHRAPLRWHEEPLWGHLAHKNCNEDKEQCASHIICAHIASTNFPITWEQVVQ